MVDIASLAIEIDTSDVARAESDLDRLGKTGQNSEAAAKGIGSAWKQALGAAASDIGKMLGEMQKLNAGQDALARSMTGFGTSFDGAARAMRSVAEALAAQRAEAGKVDAANREAAKSVDDLGAALHRTGTTAKTTASDGIGAAARATEAMTASLQEQIALFGKSHDEVLRYRAAQIGAADAVEPLIQQLSELRTAQQQAAESAQAEEQAQRNAVAAAQAADNQRTAFLASLKEQSDLQGKSRLEMLEYRAAQLGVTSEASGYIARLREAAEAQNKAGISAGQYNQAMRMLPMQLTDVATSLASGMPLWMVAIQQGGQVKDSFGGIGNAARGIVASINPMTAGLAVAGGALAGIAAAYYEGAQESTRFNEALILTGGYAGKTAAQMADMAIKMDALGGVTQGSAAEALAQVAATGKIAGDQLEMVATAAEQMRVATGKSIEETIAEFVKIGDAPVSALLDLNDKYHFLTQAQLEQIQSLKEQGKLEEAAAEGMRVYADTIADRAPKAVGNLGWIEQKWRDLKDAMRETWDGAASLGRAPGQDQQIKALNERIAYLKSTVGTGYEPLADTTGEIAKLEAQLASLTGKKAEAETVDSGLAKAGQQYLDSLKAQSIQVQDLSYHEQALQKIKTLGIDASTAQGRQIIAEADTLDQLKAKKEADTKAEREAEQAKRKMATAAEAATKRLAEYLGQSSVSATAAEAMAKAYFAGASSVRELTIQQKIEQELLKTGVGARDAVTAAVNRQQNALDRLDLGKRYADLKLDTDQLHAQAVATLAGTDALQAFNEEKLLSSALAGKNADALSDESKQLREQIKLQQQAANDVAQSSKVQGVMDRLYPQKKLLRDYTEEQQALNRAIELAPDKAGEYRAALERLGAEYEANKLSASAWGQWTISALERVDTAFADAWKNIGGGFKSFRNSLTDAFRQMLAELAHMAITKPIVLSIGAALGIGGSQQALANGGSGIWGMLSGSGSSAGGFGSLLSYGQSAYNVLTGVGPAALAGYQSGGVMGGLSGIGSYYGNMLSNAYSSVAGWFGAGSSAAASSAAASAGSTGFGYGASLVNGGIGSASYAGSAASSASSLSSSLSTVGTGLAAVGSALAIYNSYQQQGLKGALVTGGATALGAVFGGPIGAAIGSAVGNFLSGKLFGGSWQTKDYGLALDVTAGDFGAQQFEYQKKKGGLFGSNKSRTRYSDLPTDTLAGLEQTWSATESGVAGLYEQLGLHLQAGTLDGLQIARAQISTKGKSEEEIQKAVTDWFAKSGESLNTYLNQTFDTGLSYDLAGMTAFVQNLQSVNAMLTNLNVGLFDSSVAGGKMAENLSALAGGFDALSTSSATYYDKFFSTTEKADDTLAAVNKQFSALNLTLPATRAEYRAMVESIDITSEAGRSMFSSLMGLAGAADSAFSILEQRASDAQAVIAQHAAGFTSSAVSAAQGALSTLSGAINAEKQRLSDAYNARVASLNDMAGTASSAISSLNSVGGSLDSALRQLAGSSEKATALLHEQAVATLRSALAFAKAGGSLSGFAGLQAALDSAGNIGSGNYSTLEDLQREQGRTAGLISQLQGINGSQLTTEQRILNSLQGQLDQAKTDYDLQSTGLDAQLTAAQLQLDALLGIDSSVKSVADALSLFAGAMQQAQALQGANSSITSVTGLGGVKRQVASDGTVLDQNGQSMGMKVIGNQVVGTESWNSSWKMDVGQNGQLSWASGQQQNIEAWAKAQGIPGFATGGDFGGGLGMFGERGPELAVTGPMRVFNASQTADMLGGTASTATEVRGLRADMAQVFDALRAIAKHTMQTAKRVESLERWDYDGMPAVRA